MCLVLVDNRNKLIAESDIICYKYLEDNRNGMCYENMCNKHRYSKSILTPFQYQPIEIGKTYTSELVPEYIEDQSYIVELGLHSFANLEDAKLTSKKFGTVNFAIFSKCIIPKGSEYYVGEYCGMKAYASNTLSYVELV